MLLTGASGFVGSHILDSLRQHKIETAVLLRGTSATDFLNPHLAAIEVRRGAITDRESLAKAVTGVTHIVHCAGLTKAVRAAEFYEVNHLGTRNLVQAINTQGGHLEKLIHISSLAVSGPATCENPVTEESPARPVSVYGQSKLAGESEVRQNCRVPFTILRPPAVYGPRDRGFFSLFKAVRHHVLPRPNKNQALSIVYVKDLAEAVIPCLLRPESNGQTYFVASPEMITSRGMADEIARQMKCRTIPLPIPAPFLWLVCLVQQMLAQATGRASLLNLQKYAELRAVGWVCDASKLQRQLGFECRTRLTQGIGLSLDWYCREGWL